MDDPPTAPSHRAAALADAGFAARLFRVNAVILVLGLWLVSIAPATLGGALTPVLLVGDSMQPELTSGAIVVVRSEPTYDAGDVIAYRSPDGGLVVHRIVALAGDGYVVQGDALSQPDRWHPDDAAVIGRVVSRLGWLAPVLQVTKRPAALLAVIATVTVVASRGRRRVEA